MKSIAFLFLAVTGFSCTQAHALDAFRCDNDLVTVRRDSRASVVRKCGEPFLTQPLGLSSCRPYEIESIDNMVAAQAPYIVQSGPIYQGSATLCLLVDDWYYNPGSGQLLTIMRFEGKSLQSIRFGERIE
jgi:uncharacterized protein DUF2845